jgi:short-subunit dehydrogenase
MVEQGHRGSVVVVTGASSGIGRATALAFARRGYAVVVAARRREPLEQVAAGCRALGVPGVAIPVDTTDEASVRALADAVVAAFGRMDVWVNNAGVALLAPFTEAPPEVYRRVLDVDFLGYVHGARVAVPQFRRQRRGVLVNVASMLGKIAVPYASAYVASKFAVVGWSESLRMELRSDGIDVVTIVPASIDTPLFQHAGNYTGRALKAPRPVYRAEDVAAAIVACAERPERERFVGGAARILTVLRKLAPPLYERVATIVTDRDHFEDRPADATPGNVLEPVAHGTTISGGWRRSFAQRPAAATAVAVLPAIVVAGALLARGVRGRAAA